MRWRAVLTGLGASILVASTALHAQWITYPTPNVPRKADGTPNLDARAPRGRDGHPDLSGMWQPEQNIPCPKDGCPDNPKIGRAHV